MLCALPAPAPGHSHSLLFPGTSLRPGSIEIISVTNPTEAAQQPSERKLPHVFTFNKIRERLTRNKLYQKRGGGVAGFEAVVGRSTTTTAEIVGEGGHAADSAQLSVSIR